MEMSRSSTSGVRADVPFCALLMAIPPYFARRR
jgi:hypothetical protein